MTTGDDTTRKRQATIVEVADRASVALGTVSRYLNGHPIRRGNRDQIELAIAELGYRRNALAAAMKTELTNTVGFMVPSLSEFHAAVLERLSSSMRRAGWALIAYCHNNEPASVVEALDFFDAHRVDCLVMDGQVGAGERIRELVNTGMRIILYDNDIPGLAVDRVLVENKAASFRAVSHLLDIGHTRIAVLTGDARTFTGLQRYAGHDSTCTKTLLKLPP